MMQFDLPKNENSIIKVFGVGGGGSNAVNHMYRQGINGVDFYVCNTDEQALEMSPVQNKIQLGLNLTDGRGAGSLPVVGQNAALENIDEIKEILGDNTKMVFITAGMGGGTGTGAAPVIAKAAKEMGILTVGIVTYPFLFEGRKRANQANDGLEELRENVDTLLIICNDKLREIYGNLSLADAFAKADDILTTAAKGIAEIITVTGYINVDFEDVRTVMTDSGVAIMGSASAEGESRAIGAVQEALNSPLLNDNNIEGANYILLNITSGSNEVMMDEISEITDYIQDEAGLTAEIIWGTGTDESLGDRISVTLIATGFQANKTVGGIESKKRPQKVVHKLEEPIVEEEKEEAPTTSTSEEQKMEVQPEQVTMSFEQPKPKVEFKEETREDLPDGWVVKSAVEETEVSIPASVPVEEESAPVNEAEEEPIVEEENVIRYNLYDEPVEDEPAPTVEFDVSSEEVEPELPQPQAELEVEDDLEVEESGTTIMEEASVETSIEPMSIEPVAEEPVSIEPVSAPVQEPVAEVQDEPTSESSTFANELDQEEQLRRSQERILRLKELSLKMKSPSGISELENEPAYMRKNVKLDSVPHSSENNVSRYTLGQDDDDNPEIRPNNSFLHDNVD